MHENPQSVPVDLGRIVEGIRQWVEIESPSSDIDRVNAVIDCIAASVAGLPILTERISGAPRYGDVLVMRSRQGAGSGGILVLSHVDTVHPVGMLSGALRFRRVGDRLYGPGIYDMKGGAFLAFEAFRTVVQAGTHRLPIVFLFTPDEEIGSPFSRLLIEREARQARFALVTEPARDGGKVVTSRKGVGRFEAVATGVPAHSGTRHPDGHSAIAEMARQVLAIEAMTDYSRGITTSVGMISGGTAANVIAQHCRISIDLRVRDETDGRALEAAILGLKSVDPAVELVVTGAMNRPPYRKSAGTDALFRHARTLAAALGFTLVEATMAGGGSDGNFTAALGLPTLDGLGIDGEGAHTDWEHALISSIEPRMLLLRRLLETLA
jgi:glutamate carboxypeptidase